MNHSTPGLPVHHQLLESTQTRVHWIGDAIQQSHPLSSLSLPAFNLSQHQGLFKWVSSSHQVAKVLEFQLQYQSFQMNTQDWSPLGWTGWIFLQSKGLSRVFPNSVVQKHQFFRAQLLYSPTFTSTRKTIAFTRQTFVDKVMSLLFNMLSRLLITFLPRSKRLLISWLQSPSAVFGAPQNKVWHGFYCFSIYLPWSDETRYHVLRFLNVELQANFFTLLFHFHQEAL